MKHIVRTSAMLMGAMLLYKILGLIEKLILAHQFGTSAAADAYLAGSGAVLLIGLLLNDIAGPALIPTLLAHKQQANQTLAATITWTLVIMVPLTWLMSQQAFWFARIFGPGFDQATTELTAQIIRIASWSIPLLCVAALITAWFHARQAFAQPALADLMLKVGPLIGLAVIGGLAGLTYGLVLGAILRLLLLFHRQLPWLPAVGRQTPLMAALHAGWPLLINTLVSVHLIGVIETAIASTISTGAVAALAYARRIVDTPVVILPHVIARAAFPGLTELVLAGQQTELRRLLHQCIRVTFLASLPLMIIGMVLATPLVQLLLQRGAFDADSVVPTAAVMVSILPGLPALALSVLLVRFNYATGDTRWPSGIRLAGAGVQIGLALWMRRWGLTGLGWSTTIALWLETGALVWVAFRSLQTGPQFEWHFWRTLTIAGCATALLTAGLHSVLTVPESTVELLLYLSLLSAIGLCCYLVIVTLGRIQEVQNGWRLLRQRRMISKS